jgi:hypothetical protein
MHLGVGGGVIGSNHFLVVARMSWGGIRYEKLAEEMARVIRVSILLKKEKAEKYKTVMEEQ